MQSWWAEEILNAHFVHSGPWICRQPCSSQKYGFILERMFWIDASGTQPWFQQSTWIPSVPGFSLQCAGDDMDVLWVPVYHLWWWESVCISIRCFFNLLSCYFLILAVWLTDFIICDYLYFYFYIEHHKSVKSLIFKHLVCDVFFCENLSAISSNPPLLSVPFCFYVFASAPISFSHVSFSVLCIFQSLLQFFFYCLLFCISLLLPLDPLVWKPVSAN